MCVISIVYVIGKVNSRLVVIKFFGNQKSCRFSTAWGVGASSPALF